MGGGSSYLYFLPLNFVEKLSNVYICNLKSYLELEFIEFNRLKNLHNIFFFYFYISNIC